MGALQEELAETLGDIAWRIRHVELYKAGLVSQETRTLAQNRRNIQLRSPLPGVNLLSVKNLAQELDQARQIWAALEDLGSRDGGTAFCGWVISEAAYQFDLPLQDLLAWKPAPGEAIDGSRVLETALQRAITEACLKSGITEKEFWHGMKDAVQDRHDGVSTDLLLHRIALEDRLLSASFPVGEDLEELHRYEEHLTREFYEVLRQFQLLQAKRRKG